MKGPSCHNAIKAFPLFVLGTVRAGSDGISSPFPSSTRCLVFPKEKLRPSPVSKCLWWNAAEQQRVTVRSYCTTSK
jgi:hypothetical protein